MKLVSICIENFMPYKGKSKVTFPQEPGRNVMIVFGDNMRGKTSFLNAIRWGFYGRALGRHLREIPLHNLHNLEAAREGDWTMEVVIEFDADGHRYHLTRRARKRNMVAKPSRPEDFESEVLMQRDNSALMGHAIEAEISKFVPEQVSRFFLFDGELLQEYEELLIEGSEQGKKIKSAIEQVLGVPTLISGRADLATILRAATRQQSKDLEHVKGLEAQAQQQANVQTLLDSHESDLLALQGKYSETRIAREALDDDLEKVDSVHQAKLRLDENKKRRSDISADQGRLVSERLTAMRDAWRDALRPKLESERTRLLRRSEELNASAGARGRLLAEKESLSKLIDTAKCPTCDQPVHSGMDLIQVRVAQIAEQIEKTKVDPEELTETLAKMRQIDRVIQGGGVSQLPALDSANRRLEIELTRLDQEATTLEEQIRGYDTTDISRKRSLRDNLVREEGKLSNDVSQCQTRIEGAKKDLAVIARALQNMPSARVSRSTKLVQVTGALERVFSESIESLRNKLRKRVEQNASDAFKELTTQKAYSGLSINENYGLQILDEHGENVAIRSAGAEQIVALSLIDGLARAGRSVGPVVMDTPFGRLDLKHRDNILRYLPTTTSQLILLVHGGEIRRPVDLAPVASRIGASYEIREVGPRSSKIEKVMS